MKSITTIDENEFLNFYNQKSYSANCFNEDGSLNKKYNSLKTTDIIARIFEDHWNSTYFLNKSLIDKFRPNSSVKVQKIIDCYNKNLDCSHMNALLVMTLLLLVILVNLDFALLVAINIKNTELNLFFQTAYISILTPISNFLVQTNEV